MFLDVRGVALLFLFSRVPGRDEVAVFADSVVPEVKEGRAKASTAPADGAKLLRIVVLFVDNIDLVEDFLRSPETDAMLSFDVPAFRIIEPEPHFQCITVILSIEPPNCPRCLTLLGTDMGSRTACSRVTLVRLVESITRF